MKSFIFFIAFLSCFFRANAAAPYKCSGVAQYMLSFYGMWSNDTHGSNAFPPDGHFSAILGVSHENGYSLWKPGIKATEGVKEVAENGNITTLENEVMMAMMTQKTAWKMFKTPSPIQGTEHVMNLPVEVTKDFPLVSLITMIAPSPDWFTGIFNVDLCDSATGKWLDNKTLSMLQPWDAGTDNGTKFNSTDLPTTPMGYISLITRADDTPFMNSPMGMIPTFGKVMIQRRNKPQMTMCSGEATYKVKFQAMWSEQTHPNGFPSNPHFSPLVGATHTYKYKFWSPMTRSSPGVKMVAETGATTTLYNEIKSYQKTGFVYMAYKAPGSINSPTGMWSMMISAKDMYSKVSLITMIAPSPDWFVGVDSYDLCGADGKWKESGMMELPAWDAGTDSGMNFASDNSPTMPYDVITQITSSSNTVIRDDANKPFAKVMFTLQSAKAQSQSVLSILALVCPAILIFIN